MTDTRPRARRRTFFGRLVLLPVLFVLMLLGVGVALASWGATGTGTGGGAVGSLAAPTAVTVSSESSTVTVTFTGVTPPVGSLDGYVVERDDGGGWTPTCGTVPGTPATYLTAAATSCSDSGVPDGTYTYRVTAMFRSWTAASAPSNVVTVVFDPAMPSQSIAMTSPSNAHLGGPTVYFRSGTSGSFRLAATVADGETGPASAHFPAVTAAGWTHAAETVSSGVGTNPVTYTSSPFTWSAGASTPGSLTVVGRDGGNNTVSTTLSFAPDDTGPTAGALTVNGVAATAGGSFSSNRVAFPVNVRTDYASDSGSGVASSVLTREFATYSGGTCGAFGGAVTLTGAPLQSGLTTGCYRYTLTGTDNVGNTSSVSTTVLYDVTVPTAAVSLSSPGGASLTGTSVYVRTNVAGSFTLATAVTDGESGPASVTYPAVTTAGWTHPVQTVSTGTGTPPTLTYTSSTYSWTAGAGRPGNSTLTSRDVAGNTASTVLAFVRDNTAPGGSALTVNGTGGTAAGTTSFNRTGAFAIARTDYTDTGSGLLSSVLTVEQASLNNNVCGTYGAPTVISGAPAQSGLATGCYRYTLTGTDKVGITATRTTVVKVDRELPTSGALTVNGAAANAAGTTSTARAAFPIDVRTDWVDAGSGIASSTLVRTQAALTNGNCGTFGTATTLTGSPLQTGLATNCYRYVLTGTDRAGNVASVTTTVKYDVTNPTAGALTVNGTAATAGGSSSTSSSPSFTIARTDYTDAGSGLASSTLTRELAPLTGAVCGSYGSPTTLTGAPTQSGLAPGCYRYTLTGTDNAGNTVSISTTVQQRVVVTAVALVDGGGTPGRAQAGDRVSITFSDALDVATICSTWSGNGSNQSLGGDNNVSVTLTNGGAGNDTLTFSAASCTLNIGSINLGSTAYTTANVVFRGTGAGASSVTWTVATRTVTVTFGTPSGGGVATVASSTPVTTPSGALTNTTGVPVAGTLTLPNAQQL